MKMGKWRPPGNMRTYSVSYVLEPKICHFYCGSLPLHSSLLNKTNFECYHSHLHISTHNCLQLSASLHRRALKAPMRSSFISHFKFNITIEYEFEDGEMYRVRFELGTIRIVNDCSTAPPIILNLVKLLANRLVEVKASPITISCSI